MPLSAGLCGHAPVPPQAAAPRTSRPVTPRRAEAKAARACLPELPAARAFSRWAGALLGLAVMALWAVLWGAALVVTWLPAKGALALLCGTVAGLLVILGHDAAHGALTPWRTANQILARLFFLAPWQTASGWQQAHREHHAFTNLKSHDDGYPPPSPADWKAMPRWRRALWRFKHTLPGLFLFYLDVWWRRVIWPPQPDPRRAVTFCVDSLLVLAFIAVQAALVIGFGGWQHTSAAWHDPLAMVWAACELALLLGLLLVLPFVACNWWVSAITLQQHRHPQLRWFESLDAWQQGFRVTHGTVHLAWPQPGPWLLFNIFEHTAHHLDPQRPFTLLGPAQQGLSEKLPEHLIVVADPQPWRFSYLRQVLRDCQLHDYTSGRWLRFDDVPDGVVAQRGGDNSQPVT